ncbi:hypothetical protein ACM44_04870 [Chryseobacterium koreense CCUG 49689]|uniref:Uncharacterized protein n=1 Tax=Chryseobacterium koreense CCUG 49689 TaxID=1304281 RepID=A0A0J7J0J9_9FLAO|nr:hypothetical protein ACM44_04870 [Chryseobacterium koreense CCUG 49689]
MILFESSIAGKCSVTIIAESFSKKASIPAVQIPRTFCEVFFCALIRDEKTIFVGILKFKL